MSKISDFYVELNTVLATVYPTHKKMVDPQNVDQNDKFILNKGYGFYISGTTNTERLINCSYSVARDISIILSRVNRGTDRDITIRESAEKALLEDLHLLIKNVEQDVNLNNIVGSFKYTSDSGIEYLVVDEQAYLICRATFSAEYFESLA